LVVVLIASTLVVWQKTRLPYYVIMRSSYEQSGELVAKLAGPNDRVFVTEAGMIGYRAGIYVYDFGGLTSPEVCDLYRRRSLDLPLAEVWREYMPEFLVVTPRAMKRVTAEGDFEWLNLNYEVVGTFPGHQVLRRRDLAAPPGPASGSSPASP
ncbi:MAG TPA: hypothetical protein VMU02_09560, partial [bacterium]|nr:hypothetical protein [bacterium]